MDTRDAVPSRAMRAVAALLADAGVPTKDAVGGVLAGTLALYEHKLALRVDVFGNAMLYDPREGTLNLRVPKASWRVPVRGREWAPGIVKGVLEHLGTAAPAAPETQPETPPPARRRKPADDVDDHKILDLCAEGQSQASIARACGVFHSTVRRVVWGVQPRGRVEDGDLDPYKPELDPQRREMLHRRDAAGIPDDEMVRALRDRLGLTPPGAAPVKKQKKPKSPPLSLAVVRSILDQWARGVDTSTIADALPIDRHNATIRVHRIIVGEHRTRGEWERLYRLIDHVDVDVFRRDALARRGAAKLPDDKAAVELRARFAAGR